MFYLSLIAVIAVLIAANFYINELFWILEQPNNEEET